MSSRVKLLHVFSAPQSVWFFMENQLQFMLQKGYEVHVVMPDDNHYSPQIKERESGVTFHHIPFHRKISLVRDLSCLIKLLSIISKVAPHIIHLHTPKASFLGALASKLLLRKNVIYQMHGLVSSADNPKGLMYQIEKKTCWLVDYVFAVSPSLMQFAIEKDYVKNSKIRVIKNGTINGIDYKKKFNKDLTQKNKYKQDKSGQFTIGYVGRINEEKGILDYLNVIDDLASEIPIKGTVLGKNEMGSKFNLLLNNYPKAKEVITLFDEVNDPQNIMCHFDILLFPSCREGFGLAAAEVNALGIPVVAYDIPGVRDAIEDGRSGFLVPLRNLELLKNKVNYYFSNQPTLEEHGNYGKLRIPKLYDRQKLWEAIHENYKSILGVNKTILSKKKEPPLA